MSEQGNQSDQGRVSPTTADAVERLANQFTRSLEAREASLVAGGGPPRPQPEAPEEQQEQPQEVQPQAPQEAKSFDEFLASALGTEQESAPDEGEQASPEQGSLPDRFDLDFVAGQLGVDKNTLMARLEVPVGEGQQAPLHEAWPGYQRYQEHQRLAAELDTKRQAIEAQAQELQQAYQYVMGAGHIATQRLDAEEKAIVENLQQLQGISTAALSVEERLNHQERLQHAQASLNAVAQERARVEQELGQYVQTLQRQEQEQRQQVIEQGREKLHEYIPEWGKDPSLAQREAQSMMMWLRDDWGATDKDIEGIVDARLLAIIRKGWKMDQAEKAFEQARTGKRVASIRPAAPGAPAMVSASQQAARSDVNRENQLQEKLKRSGKQDDAAALISHRLQRRQR